MKKYVYIAGPITKGPRPANIHNALMAGNRIVEAGHVPFVPHLFELWDIVSPQPYEFWMTMDFCWLRKCDAVLRLPGESAGADRECCEADRLGLPVFEDMDVLMRWLA